MIPGLNNSLHLFRQQGLLLHQLRAWFHKYGYQEVYTPALVQSPALEEYLEAISIGELYLHTSPEFGMKKLLALGLPRIYQITSCYRKEELGRHHSTEFRMLEWYRVGASFWDIMDEVVALISHLAQQLGKELPAFERIPCTQLLSPDLPPEEWFFQWVDQIEPNLPPACIIYDYPAWQSALARKRGSVAARFEVYLEGVELANAFDEEGDSQEIRLRWTQSNIVRVQEGRRPYPLDEEFLSALDKMPRCSGIALGVDRLFMLLLGEDNIQTMQVPIP